MSPRPEPRIGDSERDSAVRALGEHYAAGRISKEEFDERSERALRAHYDSDLRPLFLDLPLLAPRATQPPSDTPQRWPRQPRGPRWHDVRPFPLVLVLVAVALALDAWWLLFVAWAVFACRPRHRRPSTWPHGTSRHRFG